MDEVDRYIISKNILNSLDSIPHHKIIDNIQRYIPENFPIHVAIHKITNAEKNPADYVTTHSHEAPEINILLGEKGELEYEFQLDEDVRRVTSPATIWIPSGVKHSANVRRGSGYFVCVIFSDTNSLFPDKS
jgi:cupin superfamily acireductone dioxygenase involved in methionine salvage